MTPAFARFTAPARPTPELWRLVLGVGMIAACYFGWIALMGGVAWVTLGGGLGMVAAGRDPWAVIALLLTFIGPWIGVWAAVRLLHGRSLGSVFGRAPIVLRDFTAGVGVTFLVALAGVVLLPFAPPLQAATPLGCG